MHPSCTGAPSAIVCSPLQAHLANRPDSIPPLSAGVLRTDTPNTTPLCHMLLPVDLQGHCTTAPMHQPLKLALNAALA
jgi:hypothetical protein